MSSRMDRYNEENLENTITRSMKNQDLYDLENTRSYSRMNARSNVKIIDSGVKEIDVDKIKNYILNLNESKKDNKESIEEIIEYEVKKDEILEDDDVKEYDIQSVLEKARIGREVNYEKERHKKLHSTQYDILNDLKIYENKEELINDEFNTEERTLIDLINTVTIHKDDLGLMDELTGGGDTVPPMKRVEITEEYIEETDELEKTQELTKIKIEEEIKDIDNSFYTTSMSFSKDDFDGFEELKKNIKKGSSFTVIAVVVLIVSIIATIVVLCNYFLDLGLF